ncbi:peptide-methionine (S)-S-oxide reductase MsrA [Brooklawnia propionicigenes]|uniref:Peptide methionine sulfoxide reductase MsrA n=1 Tax=Brooklawnia propionicigenes TaxID=3041175 RepID=A0AAN0K662_9ACTN|nr:peptide-methionine (S)-S-oxide reductase MsrA [Brooklawnia sp. SH051]BEH01450.1 peptide-methionine (S)-S-oxide reductase MsrA [Brooklawnia sp. SH051]
MFGFGKSVTVNAETALSGRDTPVLDASRTHRIFGEPLNADHPGAETAYFALGCFWGAEKLFWKQPGVLSTAVGYQGGYTPNPSYQQVCTGLTGHAETVRVVFDPAKISYADLVRVFFENHDPTQGNRQGNDIGTQYRSAIFTVSDAQQDTAERVRSEYQHALTDAGYGQITTAIEPAKPWYYAEDYHQQYLDANPGGYDCHIRTGVACPVS